VVICECALCTFPDKAAAAAEFARVLGALAVAVHAEVPVQRLATMMYAYPTFHRAIEDAVKRLG